MTVGCFVLAITGHAAVADVIDECNRDLIQPEVRVRACTEIKANPSFGPGDKARAYSSRGNAHADAGAIRSALADFSESIRIKRDNMPAFAGRGRAKLLAGNRIGSIEDYSEAIRLSPASAELYIERGHVYIVSRKADDAIRDFTQAIRLDPRSANGFNGRGVAYFKKGDLVRAQQDLTDAIALTPLPGFYANRGDVFEAQGRTNDAIEDFRKALLGDPSLVYARQVLERLGAINAIAIETDERVRQGEALAEKNCSGCHAVGVRGFSPNKDAPEFRNLNRRHPNSWLRAPITKGILATHEQMPQFNLPPKDVDTIVAYINSLSSKRQESYVPAAHLPVSANMRATTGLVMLCPTQLSTFSFVNLLDEINNPPP
jgi:tetratricopeptide (TPR) repeat protein